MAPQTQLMKRLLGGAATLLAAALLAACGGGSTGSARIRAEPDEVVVRVVTRGGFAEASRGDAPRVSVYGDGRVIILGPTILEFPGPALPNVQEFRVSRAGLKGIVGEARNAGLLAQPPPEYGDVGITDQPTTTVTVRDGRATSTVSVYALDFTGATALTNEQVKNRLLLSRFVAMVGDPDALHDFVVDDVRRYQPEALAVLVRRAETTGGDTHEWPLDDLADARAGCLVVSGDDLTAVLEAARSARGGDRWESAGATYDLEFRPLLPDQHDCEDLE